MHAQAKIQCCSLHSLYRYTLHRLQCSNGQPQPYSPPPPPLLPCVHAVSLLCMLLMVHYNKTTRLECSTTVTPPTPPPPQNTVLAVVMLLTVRYRLEQAGTLGEHQTRLDFFGRKLSTLACTHGLCRARDMQIKTVYHGKE